MSDSQVEPGAVSLEFAHVQGDYLQRRHKNKGNTLALLSRSCEVAGAYKRRIEVAGGRRVVTCCLVDNYNAWDAADPFGGDFSGSHDVAALGYRSVYARVVDQLHSDLQEIGLAPDAYVFEKDVAVIARHYRDILTPKGHKSLAYFAEGEDEPQVLHLESPDLNLKTVNQLRAREYSDDYAGRIPYVGLDILIWDTHRYSCPYLAALWYALRSSRACESLDRIEAGLAGKVPFYAADGSLSESHTDVSRLANVLETQFLAIEAAARYLTLRAPWRKVLESRIEYEFYGEAL